MIEKISTLDGSQLKDVLKGLKLYSDMSKKIGKRGKTLFSRHLDNSNTYRVEYMKPMTQNEAWEQSSIAFKKAFGSQPTQEEVVFSENNRLLGGIKIFQNDMMVDLSLGKTLKYIQA